MRQFISALFLLALSACATAIPPSPSDKVETVETEEQQWYPCEQSARNIPTTFHVIKDVISNPFFCAYQKGDPWIFFGKKIGVKSGHGFILADRSENAMNSIPMDDILSSM